MPDDLSLSVGLENDGLNQSIDQSEDIIKRFLDNWKQTIESASDTNIEFNTEGVDQKISELIDRIESLKSDEFIEIDSDSLDTLKSQLEEIRSLADFSNLDIAGISQLSGALKELEDLSGLNALEESRGLEKLEESADRVRRLTSLAVADSKLLAAAFSAADDKSKSLANSQEKTAKSTKDASDNANDLDQAISDLVEGEVNDLDEKFEGAFEKGHEQLENVEDTLKDLDISRAEEFQQKLQLSRGAALSIAVALADAFREQAITDFGLEDQLQLAEKLRDTILEINEARNEDRTEGATLEELKAQEEQIKKNIITLEQQKKSANEPVAFGTFVVSGTDSDPEVKRQNAAKNLLSAQEQLKVVQEAIAKSEEESAAKQKKDAEDLAQKKMESAEEEDRIRDRTVKRNEQMFQQQQKAQDRMKQSAQQALDDAEKIFKKEEEGRERIAKFDERQQKISERFSQRLAELQSRRNTPLGGFDRGIFSANERIANASSQPNRDQQEIAKLRRQQAEADRMAAAQRSELVAAANATADAVKNMESGLA